MKKNGLEKEVVILVLELAVGGELFDFMMYTGAFSEVIARTYFRQVGTSVWTLCWLETSCYYSGDELATVRVLRCLRGVASHLTSLLRGEHVHREISSNVGPDCATLLS